MFGVCVDQIYDTPCIALYRMYIRGRAVRYNVICCYPGVDAVRRASLACRLTVNTPVPHMLLYGWGVKVERVQMCHKNSSDRRFNGELGIEMSQHEHNLLFCLCK